MANAGFVAWISPRSSWFTEGSERWLEEQDALRLELEKALGRDALRQADPEPGAKGRPLGPIAIALGDDRSFRSLARALSEWVRNGTGERSLTITATINDEEISVPIDERNASVDALLPFMRALSEVPRDTPGEASREARS